MKHCGKTIPQLPNGDSSLYTREPLYIIPLRIVGSGFCPIMRGLPRAMLAPDVSVGKTENITLIDNFSLKMRY